MAIVREQYKVGQGNGTSLAVTFDTSVTAGSLLLCVASVFSQDGPVTPGTISVSDNQANSWNETYNTNYDTLDIGFLAYAENVSSGSTTITITANTSDTYYSIVIIEVSGIKTTTSLDQNNENTTTSSSWDSGNITTTENDEYLIGGFAHDNGNRTLTEDGAWTLIFEEQNGSTDMPISVGERIVSSTLTESYSGTIGASSLYWSAIASFEAEAAAAVGDIAPILRISKRPQNRLLRM